MPLDPEIRAYLESPYYGVLATTNPDGTSQQTVMWYALDGDTIVMNTGAGRRKHRNIEANPAVSLCVYDGRRYVTVRGRAVIEPDDAKLHRAIGARYEPDDKLDQLFRDSFDRQQRVTIRMSIEHVLDGRDV